MPIPAITKYGGVGRGRQAAPTYIRNSKYYSAYHKNSEQKPWIVVDSRPLQKNSSWMPLMPVERMFMYRKSKFRFFQIFPSFFNFSRFSQVCVRLFQVFQVFSGSVQMVSGFFRSCSSFFRFFQVLDHIFFCL